MITSWALVTAPASEPITLTEGKSQARITDSNSDALITSYIAAARQEAEAVLNYGLFTQTWRYDLSEWAEVIPLPMALKLGSITHVKYYDTDGVLQTLSSTVYTTDTIARPAALVRASAQSWPSLQSDRNTGRIQITYVVGWALVADIPERIKQGIRMYVTYLDADRDGMETQAEAALKAAHRCWSDQLYHIEPQLCRE